MKVGVGNLCSSFASCPQVGQTVHPISMFEMSVYKTDPFHKSILKL